MGIQLPKLTSLPNPLKRPFTSDAAPDTNATQTSTNPGAPPRYTSPISKVYPYSLRPVLGITSVLGLAWAVILGVQNIRDRGDAFETAKMKLFDIILAALYFVVAAIEVFGLVCTFFPRPKLARLLIPLAPLGVIVSVVDQIIAVVAHFVAKGDLINQCINDTQGGTELTNFNGMAEPIDHDQAVSLCNNAWSQGTYSVIGWLVATAILSSIFAYVAISFYRQVLDPSFMQGNQRSQQAFPMRPPPPGQAWGRPGEQQPWMVPPYPGPPAGGSTPYEKSDYQPNAEWANNDVSYAYAPPEGSPPRQNRNLANDSSDGLVNHAEEAAWERARSGGVTAHLTGHGPAPRQGRDEEEGYVISNPAEDEAWERARTEGVTAHLTGQASGSGSNKRNTEGDI